MFSELGLTESAARGQKLWRQSGCASCHSIFGKGGHIGVDLTNVIRRRGETYVRIILRHGKSAMPVITLNDDNIDHLVSYLNYINRQGTYPLTGDLSNQFFGHNENI